MPPAPMRGRVQTKSDMSAEIRKGSACAFGGTYDFLLINDCDRVNLDQVAGDSVVSAAPRRWR